MALADGRTHGAECSPLVRRSLAAELARGYLRPRRAFGRQAETGLSDPRSLFHLLAGCLLLCAASIPGAIASAGDLPVEDAVSAAIAARIFGFMIVLPLVVYAACLPLRQIARLCGGAGSGLATRAAVFWSVLQGGPLALLVSAVAAVRGMESEALAAAVLAYWLWLLAATLAAAEAYRTWRVLAALCLAFGCVVVVMKLSV